jgi:hypothetical protein
MSRTYLLVHTVTALKDGMFDESIVPNKTF